jgi:RES domain-containing protein
LKQPVLLPLAANHGALRDLEELEGATSGRLQTQQRGLTDLAPAELVYGRPNHTFINAAFAYTRPGGSRFNDETRGAWYCAFEVETSLAEVGFHLTRELTNIGRFDNTTDYAELLADFIGEFHDARGLVPPPEYLSPETETAYPVGQALARELRAQHSPGLIYPSVRRAAGTCLVAFVPGVVQNVRQGGLWRLEWRGTPDPAITPNPK